MSNNLILRTQISPYGDETKGSVLSQAELDNNFIFLKGLDIDNVNLDGTTLQLNRLNGETISVSLDDFMGPAGPAGAAGADGASGAQGPQGPAGVGGGSVSAATYSYTTGILTLQNNDGTSINVDGFITGGSADSTLGTLTLNNSDGTSIIINGFSTGTTPTYTNATPTTAGLGGIPQSTTFLNQTMQQMFDALLYPYQVPAFTSFARTNLTTVYDLGQPILIGSQTFSWVTSNSSNVSANTITIEQLSPSTTTLVSSSANDGSQTVTLSIDISSATATSTALNLYRVTATDTQGTSFNRTITAFWRNRWYYGKFIGSTITNAEITGLTSALTTGVRNSGISVPLNAGAPQYIYLVIPSSLPQINGPTGLRDSTSGCFGSNHPYSSLGTTTFSNQYGISTTYNVYQLVNATAGALNIWICA
jgi:hypothetical protein